MEKQGITVCGTALMDVIKPVESYPAEGCLANIDSISYASGGALCNVLLSLHKLDPDMPLAAIGVIGNDSIGDRTMNALSQAKTCDFSGIRRAGIGSFSDVYQSHRSKQRTFFHCKGANSLLNRADFNVDSIHSKILYIGYIQLLDALDAEEEEYGTELAHLLHDIWQKGIETAIDMVGEQSNRIQKIGPPSLKYCTYCIINEEEAERLTGIPLKDSNGNIIRSALEDALRKIKDFGVSKWAIIHSPKLSAGMDENFRIHYQKSPDLPADYIVGTVGAGDAFCSGVLYSAYHAQNLQYALQAGTAAACCSLAAAGANEGMKTMQECFSQLTRLSGE